MVKYLTETVPKKKIKWDFNEPNKLLGWKKVHTVCEESRCPNRYECSQNHLATYLIGGRVCTRSCKFCHIATGKPEPLEDMMQEELQEILTSVDELQLKYAVITSVARDDNEILLSQHFANITNALKKKNIHTELLIPDFHGKEPYLHTIGESSPLVIAHNIETTISLSHNIRPQAAYERSLQVLTFFYENYPSIYRKSAIMLGLGESIEEVIQTLQDLRNHHVDIITIGQYMQPSSAQAKVQTYISNTIFDELKQVCNNLGFLAYEIGPFVRSSYMANKTMEKLINHHR